MNCSIKVGLFVADQVKLRHNCQGEIVAVAALSLAWKVLLPTVKVESSARLAKVPAIRVAASITNRREDCANRESRGAKIG